MSRYSVVWETKLGELVFLIVLLTGVNMSCRSLEECIKTPQFGFLTVFVYLTDFFLQGLSPLSF